MIDASKGFIKDGNKNRLRAQDIHRIVDTFTRQLDVPRYARMVPLSRSATRRTTSTSTSRATSTAPSPRTCRTSTATCAAASRTATSTRSTATGRCFPAVRAALFESAGRPGYCRLEAAAAEIKAAIFAHAEFTAFNAAVTETLCQSGGRPTPRGSTPSSPATIPRRLIETLSEDLARHLPEGPLLDPYDVYQHLMDYWAETMQDDVYLLVQDGWKAVQR